MIFKRIFIITLGITFCLSLGFSAGYITNDLLGTRSTQFPILSQAYEILVNNGLKAPPANPALEYGMIRGMVEAYGDPYSVFVEPAAHVIETDNLQGRFGGIGVRVNQDENGSFLLFPFPEGPASKAGLLDGDRLVEVGDLEVSPALQVDKIQAALRGPVGGTVRIVIERPPDYSRLSFDIVRIEIEIPSVTWHIYPSETRLGIIEINLLAASTPGEVQKAVSDLQARGATTFLLDLRNNGGGLLTSGIDTARLFLEDGTIIEQQFRGKDPENFQVDQPGSLLDLPLAVLVNHGTASAAEILAGALQAHGRAFLVGTPTYGKDTIQLIFDLQDGSSIHVTSGKWQLPNATTLLEGHGLQPDYILSADEAGTDVAIDTAARLFFK